MFSNPKYEVMDQNDTYNEINIPKPCAKPPLYIESNEAGLSSPAIVNNVVFVFRTTIWRQYSPSSNTDQRSPLFF